MQVQPLPRYFQPYFSSLLSTHNPKARYRSTAYSSRQVEKSETNVQNVDTLKELQKSVFMECGQVISCGSSVDSPANGESNSCLTASRRTEQCTSLQATLTCTSMCLSPTPSLPLSHQPTRIPPHSKPA
jgi:hypothetical protein